MSPSRRGRQRVRRATGHLRPVAIDLVEVTATISAPALLVDGAMEVHPAASSPTSLHTAVWLLPRQALRPGILVGQTGLQVCQGPHVWMPVSYTHLTLPTIL